MRSAPIRLPGGGYAEPPPDLLSSRALLRGLVWLGVILFLGICLRLAEVDPVRLAEGLPRMAAWAARAWPPDLRELDLALLRAAETVAIATVGTLAATLLAFPTSLFIARNVMPWPPLGVTVRLVVNACRGIDTVVFALLFVAAVGLGPFAGVMGMLVHSLGVIAKLNAEAIETLPAAPMEAAAMTGAGRTAIVAFAVLPSVAPQLASVALYVWEANVRISTILGLVGAGGIGLEIKAAIDLLDFPRLLTLSVIVLAMVTAIDAASAWARARLL